MTVYTKILTPPIITLQNELVNLQAQQSQLFVSPKEQKKIFDELVAQYPKVFKLALAKSEELQKDRAAKSTVLLVNISTKQALSRVEKQKISAWLKVRSEVDQVKLSIEAH